MELTGIDSVNEYYTSYYLDASLKLMLRPGTKPTTNRHVFVTICTFAVVPANLARR